jgi:hypothetical protein
VGGPKAIVSTRLNHHPEQITKPDKAAAARELERLLYARRTIYTAGAAAVFVAKNANDPDGDIYPALAAGLVVTYARPFVSASGLGVLPHKYQQFPDDPRIDVVHKDVMKARHSLYAHFSPTEANALLPTNAKREHRCTIRIKGGEMNRFAVLTTGWSPKSLRLFCLLCDFQINRLMADANKLFKHIKGTDTYPDGEYDLGVSFPNPKNLHDQT